MGDEDVLLLGERHRGVRTELAAEPGLLVPPERRPVPHRGVGVHAEVAGLDGAGDPQTPNSAAVNKTPTWYVPLYDDLTEVVIGAFSITNTGVTLDAEDHPVTYPTPVLILVQ